MRILMLTQWFQPEPFYKGLPLAKALQARGHDVQVLTGFPNYPGGKVYPGYRIRAWQHELLEGIRVLRVPLYPSHDSSSIGRIANYTSFAFSSLVGALVGVDAPEVVLAYNLVTLAPTLSLLRRLYRCPAVLDVQDLWPESIIASGMLKLSGIDRVLSMLSDWGYRSADIVLAQSPGMQRALIERGVSVERLEILYNWTEEAAPVRPKPNVELMDELGIRDTFNVLFAGTMGKVQRLDIVLDAAERLAQVAPQVRIVLVGGGVEVTSLMQRAQSMRLGNVIFLPRQPRANMGQIMSIAQVGLVHLQDAPLFRITIPSKTQAYLRDGLPIVMAVEGDARLLVEKSGAGFGCSPCDPESLAETIIRMSELSSADLIRMGECGRTFYEREMSFDVGVNRLESYLRRARDLGPAGRAAAHQH